MTKQQKLRTARLLLKGIPRYVRCYDNGGPDHLGTIDRYTAVFAKKSITEDRPLAFAYIGMSGSPFHPQGFGQHGESKGCPADAFDGKWPPAIGRKNHLGTRIAFQDLPTDCQKLVLQDYKELWSL